LFKKFKLKFIFTCGIEYKTSYTILNTKIFSKAEKLIFVEIFLLLIFTHCRR